jgi:hypothetical protein
MWRRFLCFIGWHSWIYERPLDVLDLRTLLGEDYKTPLRVCRHCHRVQEWLLGYGGSEPGCWIRTR